jgi:ATP-dependent helicase HrpB
MASDIDTLPVNACLPALLAVLDRGANAVLVAPPGAGKTTLVPPALLDATWRGDQRIVMLEPRRLAARAAASRMSALLGKKVGGLVGYRTRLDQAVSAATRIEVITEGLLVRRLQTDPGLDGVAAVIFDEVHERALEADLALAFCRDLQITLRPELRLLAMSATPDTSRLVTLLSAELVESAGRAHPVTIQHVARDITRVTDLPAAMAQAVRGALTAHSGDILAFLPGMGEIRRTQALLEGIAADVLILHGDLPAAEQDFALRPGTQRRVVLATSIAETSLTVPGVRVVIDGGWRRTPRLDAGTGLTRLATVRISVAAAAQRAGRAGREAPGVAIRLWTLALHRTLAPFDRPEILEAELSGLRLDCAGWGAEPAALPFPDQPPAGALAAATDLLGQLGALDNRAALTDLGRAMVRLGAHPRLAAMMLAAQNPGEVALAADLAAILEERDPLRGADRDPPADILLRLAALSHPDPDADRGTIARIRATAASYRRRLDVPPATPPTGDAGTLLAAGFPDRLAQRRGQPGSFRFSGGGGAQISERDPLARADLLVAASVEQKTSTRIRLAAVLAPDRLPPSLVAQVVESIEVTADPVSGNVLTRRRRRLGALVLEDRTEAADPAQIEQVLRRQATSDPAALPWTDAARQFQARVAWLRRLEPADWPDMSDAAVADSVAPALAGLRRLADLDLMKHLRGMLDYRQIRLLDQALPAALTLPHGSAAVDYLQDIPTVSAKAQLFYGLAATPKLAEGRVPLRLALLSPAGRPIAITADIAGFWHGAWPEVRRDMRGRYPKHDWPDHPGA